MFRSKLNFSDKICSLNLKFFPCLVGRDLIVLSQHLQEGIQISWRGMHAHSSGIQEALVRIPTYYFEVQIPQVFTARRGLFFLPGIPF